MHTSLVKQKPFATEIKYTKIIFTIISKRQHKKDKKSAQKAFHCTTNFYAFMNFKVDFVILTSDFKIPYSSVNT